MKTHLDCKGHGGRWALVLGAAALALAGVMAPVHLALAHQCDVDHGDPGSCTVCLHWQHHAAHQAPVWSAPQPQPVDRPQLIATPRTCDLPQHPTRCRAPPA